MNTSTVSAWGVDSPWHRQPGMNNTILSTGTERLDPAGERYASLENVHKLVEEELMRDEQERLEIENVGQGAGYEKDEWNIEFVGSAVVDRLPEVVASRLENMEDLCFFGLLPELNLAWVSVDDALCIWSPNPQDGPRPPARTLHCKDYITAVCLVRPDPKKSYDCDGMPLFFLAVALRESVQLYKLELSDTEIALHDTPIEIPVDSFVCRMVSTPNGRLFVGCSDGCVYELRYEEEDYSLSSFWRPRQFRKTSCQGWRLADFGRRVSTLWQPYEADPVTDMCFDPSRHVLYAVTQHRADQTARQAVASALLSTRTHIHAYILGSGGDSPPRHIGPARLDQLAAACSSVQAKDRDIVAIHPILASESAHHHCALVSSTGFRLYLELSESSGLRIRTVRPPPPPLAGELVRVQGGQGRQPEEPQARVQASFYKDGVFLLGLPGMVVCVCQDRNRDSFRPGETREVWSVLSVPNDVQGQPVHLWQIAETRPRLRSAAVPAPGQGALAQERSKMQSTNELWTQHVTHPRRFICLGGNGVVLVNRRQPWEKMEFACRHQLYSQTASRALQGSDVVHRYILRFPKEQACATALLWWVLAAGDRGSDMHAAAAGGNRGGRQSSGAMAANVLFEPLYSHSMEQSGSLGPGGGVGQAGRDARLRGILIALARLLRPYWSQRVFDFSSGGVPQYEWQRLVEQLELVARFLTEYEERLQGRHLQVSARQVRELVKQCKECCSLMAIVGHKSFVGALRELDLSQSRELEFKGLVLRLVCRPRDNEMLQQQILNLIYKLIEDGTLPAHARGGRPAQLSPSSISDQVSRAAAKRDKLLRDIERHCPSIFRPAERAKMRADKCLAEAKAAASLDPDRQQACLAEAREHYDKVSRELNTEDLIRMCQSFSELAHPLAALHVLLKRFSELVEVPGVEADILRELLQRIAALDEQSVLESALQLSLEHKGLYRQAIRGDAAEPAVYAVFRAVLEHPNSGFLWPLLRRLPILRKTTAPQQFLVEFLRVMVLPEKLVELYTETGHYSKAGEVCMQQANARAMQGASSTADLSPTLDDRIYWFRQAAKAAKLNGGALNNHVQATLLDQYADIAHIQKHLLEHMEQRSDNRPEARELTGTLKAGLVSMQELFERACEFDAFEVAMEVCEVASAAGEVQAEQLSLSDVVSKLWKLMLQQAWGGERKETALLAPAEAEAAWRRVESSVCDIGRRYARKAGFLPLQDLVVWLEDCAFKHFYSAEPEWVEACKAEGGQFPFWCGQGEGGGSTLDAPAWRVPRLLLLGFGVGHLKLIRVYYDLYDSTLLGGDARRRVHCFRTLVMLYTLYLREARDTEQEALMPFAAIENDFVRLEAKPGVYAQELSHARGLLRALRTRRQQGFL